MFAVSCFFVYEWIFFTDTGWLHLQPIIRTADILTLYLYLTMEILYLWSEMHNKNSIVTDHLAHQTWPEIIWVVLVSIYYTKHEAYLLLFI